MNNLKIAVVIDNERRRGQLTPDFLGDLRAANNPKIILVVGKTREGKSTLFNHILSNKSNNPPLRPSAPFLANAGENAITREFQYYGPIKCSELARLNLFQNLNFPIDMYYVENSTKIEILPAVQKSTFNFDLDYSNTIVNSKNKIMDLKIKMIY